MSMGDCWSAAAAAGTYHAANVRPTSHHHAPGIRETESRARGGAPVPPKGYHPIASWFAAISLHDTLRLTRLSDARLRSMRFGGRDQKMGLLRRGRRRLIGRWKRIWRCGRIG